MTSPCITAATGHTGCVHFCTFLYSSPTSTRNMPVTCFAHVRPCAQGCCGRCPPESGVMSDLVVCFFTGFKAVASADAFSSHCTLLRLPAELSLRQHIHAHTTTVAVLPRRQTVKPCACGFEGSIGPLHWMYVCMVGSVSMWIRLRNQ